jgi:hypothetical protein
MAWQNSYLYYNEASMSAADDYFDSSKSVILTRTSIKQLLEKNELYSVDRNYDDSKGYNRVQ